jgi:hypothetical protein
VIAKPEEGREEHADLTDVDGDAEGVGEPVQGARGEHEAGVDSASHNTAQGIPRSLIEPVPEVIHSILNKVLRGTEVEPAKVSTQITAKRSKPGVELVNDAFEANHSEKTTGERDNEDESQDGGL